MAGTPEENPKKVTGRWQECAICSNIQDTESEFWKGGKLESGGLPKEVGKFQIVGSPYYDDSTSHSNMCIKQCPECGTFYRWYMEYEYLVNGSEDDISLKRLSPKEGKQAVQQVLAAVQRAKQKFLEEAQVQVQALTRHTNMKHVKVATDFFSYNQRVYKEDISFAMPALIEVLANHKHTTPKCELGQSIFWVLRNLVDNHPENTEKMLALLQGMDAAENPPEVHELIAKLGMDKQ